MTQAQIPVTVFSGFLGSGKTTIITHIIDELQQQGIQVVFIKNEIGSENIDATLMQGKHIQTKELLNGCICCTLVGPFIQAIDEIALTLKPDRIIIEASGAADPAAIALMIDSQPRLIRDGVLCVIDVSNFEGYSDLSQTAKNQTRFTDLLVFNKIELVDLERKRAVVGYVRELNDHAPVVEAPGGILPAAIACGIATTELTKLLNSFALEQHDANHHHDHLAVDGITSFHISLTQAIDIAKLQKALEQTPHSIYRIKGIVHSEDGRFYLVNKVGNRITLLQAPDDFQVATESIVCIGFNIMEHQTDITQAVTSCYVSLS